MPTNLEGINFAVKPASAVSDLEYAKLHVVSSEAWSESLHLKLFTEELDYYLYSGDLLGYIRSRKDPQSLVEDGRMNLNQAYFRPYLAIAYQDKSPIGYAYSTDNVSGATELTRLRKQLTLVKNYRWLRDVVVRPEFQHRGIAHALGHLSFNKALPFQPGTAYTWPELLPDADGILQSWYLQPTNTEDPDEVYPFGEPRISSTTKQVRYVTKNARQTAATIAENAGFSERLRRVARHGLAERLLHPLLEDNLGVDN